MNGYAYADNNPIVHSDPTGLRTDPFADVHGNTQWANRDKPASNPQRFDYPTPSRSYNFPGPTGP